MHCEALTVIVCVVEGGYIEAVRKMLYLIYVVTK